MPQGERLGRCDGLPLHGGHHARYGGHHARYGGAPWLAVDQLQGSGAEHRSPGRGHQSCAALRSCAAALRLPGASRVGVVTIAGIAVAGVGAASISCRACSSPASWIGATTIAIGSAVCTSIATCAVTVIGDGTTPPSDTCTTTIEFTQAVRLCFGAENPGGGLPAPGSAISARWRYSGNAPRYHRG